MSKEYTWRTHINGAVYVDSDTGDDINGLGTRENPYQSLGKAWRASTTKPSTIICRGYFQEDMADGDFSTRISGDYQGAAVFDGGDLYTIYGFRLSAMIVENCLPDYDSITVTAGDRNYAGVGSTSVAVGSSHDASCYSSFDGHRCTIGNSIHYWGLIGGGGSFNTIYRPRRNPVWGLFFFGRATSNNWGIYGVKKKDRAFHPKNTVANNRFSSSLFGDCAFFVNDHITFNKCYFGNDCTWWDTNHNQIVLEGNTSEEKIAFLSKKMNELAGTLACTFVDCVFLEKDSYEIFNNPDLGDLTTKLDSGVPYNVGSLGPALNIPIYSRTEIEDNNYSVDNMWDPSSATGCVYVSENQILLSPSGDYGSISTGLISINTDKYQVNKVVSSIASKFNTGYVINDKQFYGTAYNPGVNLPIGKYIVKGDVIYDDVHYSDNCVLTVTEEGTQIFPYYDAEGKIVEITNPNLEVAVYVRTFPNYLDVIQVSPYHLEDNKVYFVAHAPSSTTLHGSDGSPVRGVYSGSVLDGIEGYSLKSKESNLRVGTLSSTNSVWLPAQTYGELWTAKLGNTIVKDDDGIPLSCGNPNSYAPSLSSSNPVIAPGLLKRHLNHQYLQFKIVVKKI